MLAGAGFVTLVFDFRGCGESEGSFGGYHAALVSEQRNVKSLMLVAPAIYKDGWWNITPESIEETRRNIYREIDNIDSTKVFKSLEKYGGNLLIIEHEHDEIIPKHITHAYYDHTVHAIKRKLKVIKDAPHALHDEKLRNESNKLTIDWFIETL